MANTEVGSAIVKLRIATDRVREDIQKAIRDGFRGVPEEARKQGVEAGRAYGEGFREGLESSNIAASLLKITDELQGAAARAGERAGMEYARAYRERLTNDLRNIPAPRMEDTKSAPTGGSQSRSDAEERSRREERERSESRPSYVPPPRTPRAPRDEPREPREPDESSKSRTIKWKLELDTEQLTGGLEKALVVVKALGMAAAASMAVLAGMSALGSITELVGALGQMLGIVLLLPAAGVAAGAAFGTIKLGISGVGAAFQAMGAAAKNANEDAYSLNQAHIAAVDALASAVHGVQTAREGLANSEFEEKQAQVALNQAYIDTTRSIRDQNNSLEEAKLSTESAQYAVEDAALALQKVNADPTSTPLERQKADLEYRQSLERLKEQKEKTNDLSQDVAKANKKGVDGNKTVIDANHALQQSQEGVANSNWALAQAIREETKARNDLHHQETTAVGDALALQKAMGQLSGNAQDFVTKVFGLRDSFKGLKMDVQQQLFAGLGDQVVALAHVQIPVLAKGLGDIAGDFNAVAKQVVGVFDTHGAADQFSAMLEQVHQSLKNMTPAFADIAKAFLNIAGVGTSFLPQMGTSVANIARGIEQWSTNTDHVHDVIQRALTAFKEVGTIIWNLGGIFHSVFGAGAALGDSLLKTIGDNLKQFNQFLKTAQGQSGIGDFFKSTSEAAHALSPIIKDVAQGIGVIAKGLLQFAQAAAPGLDTFLKGLVDGLKGLLPAMAPLGQALGGVMAALAPFIKDFGGVLGQVFKDMAPVLPVIGKALNDVLEAVLPLVAPLMRIVDILAGALGQAISSIASALAPFISELANALVPLMPVFASMLQALQPAISVLAQAIGTILTQALKALEPYLPSLMKSIGDVIGSLVRLVPPVVDLAMKFLPLFVDILKVAAPVLSWLAGVIAEVVSVLVDILVPAIRVVSAVVGALWDVIKVVFKAIGDVIGFTWNTFLKPIFDLWLWNLKLIGDIFKAIFELTVIPIWNGLVTVFKGVWDTALKPMWDAFKTAIGSIGDAFNLIAKPIEDVWDGIIRTIAKAVGVIGKLIKDIPSVHIPGTDVTLGGDPGGIGAKLTAWADANSKRDGGAIYGPGGPRDDDVPIMASNGEHMWAADEVRRAGGHGEVARMRRHVRNGGLLRGYADGGPIVALGASSTPGAPTGDSSGITTALGGLFAATPGANSMQVFASLFGNLGSAVTPAWTSMADDLSKVQQKTLTPLLDDTTKRINDLGAATTTNVTQTIRPAWDDLGKSMGDTKTKTIDPVFAGVKDAITTTVTAFGQGATDIGTQWGKVKDNTAAPVRWTIDNVFNNGIVGAWNSVASIIGAKPLQPYTVQGFAEGGQVTGGIAGRDSVPALLMPEEFVFSKPAVKAAGLGNLVKFNNAALGGSPINPQSLFVDGAGTPRVGMAVGGMPAQAMSDAIKKVAQAEAFATQFTGKPYILGGALPLGTDCSGFMGSIAAVINGTDPFRRYWSTEDGGGWFKQGFVPGLGAGFSIGIHHGGPAGGHTAGTLGGMPGLPNVNVESGGSHGDVRAGGSAVGADSSQFEEHYHLPISDGKFVSAGMGTPGTTMVQLLDGLMQPALTAVGAAAAAYGSSTAGAVGQIPSAIFGTVQSAMMTTVNNAASALDRVTGAGGAKQWDGLVKQALRMTGNPESLAGVVEEQIDIESSGNPRAVNDWDSNAQAGTPSEGLLQIIHGTFEEYRDKTLPDDVFNPLANLVAGINDADSKYGGITKIWPKRLGYDSGGIIPQGLTGVVNGLTQPEALLNPNQWKMAADAITFVTKMVNPQAAMTNALTRPATTPPAPTQALTPGDNKQSAAAQNAENQTLGAQGGSLAPGTPGYDAAMGPDNPDPNSLQARLQHTTDTFETGAKDWAKNAGKEVLGEFLDPLGLSGIADKGYDQLFDVISKAITDGMTKAQIERDNQTMGMAPGVNQGYGTGLRPGYAGPYTPAPAAPNKPPTPAQLQHAQQIAGTINFVGMDPQKVMDELARIMQQGNQMISRWRNV